MIKKRKQSKSKTNLSDNTDIRIKKEKNILNKYRNEDIKWKKYKICKKLMTCCQFILQE